MKLSELQHILDLARARNMDPDKVEVLIRVEDGMRFDMTPVLLESKADHTQHKLYLLPYKMMEPDKSFEKILEDAKKRAERTATAKAKGLS